MAWNEPGNGKKKDPWSSGGDQPPDLDEVFRNLQNRLRGIFGGGRGTPTGGTGSGGFGVGWLIVGLLLVWIAVSSVHIIDEPERGVVLRFGQHVRVLQPGLNFTWPPPIERVQTVDVDQVRSVTKEGAMLTRDENIVEVDLAVQYRVKNAEDFLFQVENPEETLGQASESAMRQVIGDNEMDFVLLEGRAEIALQMRQILQDILDRYQTGLELTAVNLQEVRPPQAVKEAFDDAISAREDKERLQNEAEAYANGIVPEARGRAARIVQEAEAYKASITAVAEGEAQRFILQLTEYLRAPEVTRQRLFLETMERVMGESAKVLIDAKGNNVMYLPLEELMKYTAPTAVRSQDRRSDGDNSTSPYSVPAPQEGAYRTPREGSRSGREGR